MNINHISVSRRGVYLECPKKYKFQYHDKIPQKDEPFYFTYGKIVHKIAELYVENKGEVLIEEIKQDVLGGGVEIDNEAFCPPLKAWPKGYSKRLPGMLTSIVKISDKIGYDGENHQEYEFLHDLDGEGRCVKGFIDRIFIKDNFYTVIDYKTTKKGRYRKTPENIGKDLQLRTYARVVQLKFDVPAENIRCALCYLEGGNVIGGQYTQDALEYAEKELLEAYKQIEETDAENAWASVGEHCRRCPYNNICTKYRI